MTRKNYILILLIVGLSIFSVRGQQIANYIVNGSFEQVHHCTFTSTVYPPKSWTYIDSTFFGNIDFAHVCRGDVPWTNGGFQYPRSGGALAEIQSLCQPTVCVPSNSRGYIKNRLKTNLQSGKTYCVKFYVNVQNNSSYGIDSYGAFFGDNSLDTINYTNSALTYLNPQIQNPVGNILTDTLNWTLVTGTFVANGSEKFAVIGNFKSDAATTKTLINSSTSYLGINNTFFLDDVSCIPLDISAYAGPDAFCIPGNSIYIGRQQDVGIDEACMWYKLPNMTTAIDTAAGTWVTPTTSTSTYVVKQDICGVIKYDTVIVYQSGVGVNQLQMCSDKINLSPNPTADNLNISFPQGVSQIIITNSLGQNIRQQDIDIKSNQINLQTFDLKNGLYQINFKYTFGSATKKFVKID
ncbi:MAG: T9SS type A sorting domain-containing protein [Sphingobacteriaceae bacterium]